MLHSGKKPLTFLRQRNKSEEFHMKRFSSLSTLPHYL